MTEWTRMTLRLPAPVHAALVGDAKERDTSLNQVIVDRLNRSLGGVYVSESEANDGAILQRLIAIERRLDRLEGHSHEVAESKHSSKKSGEVLRELKNRLVVDRE